MRTRVVVRLDIWLCWLHLGTWCCGHCKWPHLHSVTQHKAIKVHGHQRPESLTMCSGFFYCCTFQANNWLSCGTISRCTYFNMQDLSAFYWRMLMRWNRSALTARTHWNLHSHGEHSPSESHTVELIDNRFYFFHFVDIVSTTNVYHFDSNSAPRQIPLASREYVYFWIECCIFNSDAHKHTLWQNRWMNRQGMRRSVDECRHVLRRYGLCILSSRSQPK